MATDVGTIATVTGSTTLAPAWNANQPRTAGDMLEFVVTSLNVNSEAPTCTTPAGWSAGPTRTVSNGVNRIASFIFYKVATGSDAAPAVTLNATTAKAIGFLTEINGLDASATPVDVTWTGASATSASGTLTAGTASTTGAGDRIRAVLAMRYLTGSPTLTWGGGMTQDSVQQFNSLSAAIAKQDAATAASYSPSVTYGSAASGQVLTAYAFKAASTTKSGSASVSNTWTGAAAGSTTHTGSASATDTWHGASTGAASYRGSASTSDSWSGSATGTAPALAQHAGSASGDDSWSATASGERHASGEVAGAASWTGSATGHAPVVGQNVGYAEGLVSWSATASGSITTDGEATGATSWTGDSAGTADHSGASSVSVSWTASAAGHTPGVDELSGSATATITWTAVASGGTTCSGSATGSSSFVASANGSSDYSGTVTSSFAWSGSATGEQTPPQPIRRDLDLAFTPLPERWRFTASEPRWGFTPTPERWHFTEAPMDEIDLAEGGRGYVGGTYTEKTGKNISGVTVMLAVGTYAASGGDWQPAEQSPGASPSQIVVKLLIGEGGYMPPHGATWLWGKPQDDPEILPKRLCEVPILYPAS